MKKWIIALIATVLTLAATPIAAQDIQTATVEDKLVALTFDDGSSPYTADLLNRLRSKGVFVTFFVNGSTCGIYGAVTERAAMEGHEIANHTQNHKDLTVLTAEEIRTEIESSENILKAITGKSSFLLRSPYGYTNELVLSTANRPFIKWSVDTYDWAIRDSADLTNRLVTKVKDGDIILMHDTVATTPQGVEHAIDALREKGFAFVTVSQLLTAKGVTPQNGVIYKNIAGNIVNPEVIPHCNPYGFDESKLSSHWAYPDIRMMRKLGLMIGVENNRFLPEYPMTRAMFITVLYRMSGENYQGKGATYCDVEANSWYETATAWAAANKICYGVGENRFAPYKTITREEASTMLNRYAQYPLTENEAPKTTFADAHLISSWAKESIDTLTKKQILHGRPSRLGVAFDPQRYCTRAEAAAILSRFYRSDGTPQTTD